MLVGEEKETIRETLWKITQDLATCMNIADDIRVKLFKQNECEGKPVENVTPANDVPPAIEDYVNQIAARSFLLQTTLSFVSDQL